MPYLEKYMKKLMGNTEIEDSLQRLDTLTQEEARMASAELLKVTHSVDGKVMVIDDRVKGVEGKVQDVHTDVQDVGNKVQGVEGKVQDVRGDVQDVGNMVQGVDGRVQGIGSDVKDISSEVRLVRDVDNKLDQVNRSSSLYHLFIVSSAQTYSQGINSKIVFYDGFHPQIHQSIITSHPKFVTTARLNGSFKAVYSINGNPQTPFCGYTENVRYS
jgi:prophage DNA circulation protein